MFGVIAMGVIARNQMVNTVSKNQKYIDAYVKKYDGDFVYSHSETLENGVKRFYYKSNKFPDFVLTIDYDVGGDGTTLTDNYSTLTMQQQVLNYWKDFFGEDALVSITNCQELNILSTIDETLSYNDFEFVVGFVISDDIDEKIDICISQLQEQKVDCSVYFYYLSPAHFAEYAKNGMEISVDKFENYTMVIIRNGELDTKIKYQ